MDQTHREGCWRQGLRVQPLLRAKIEEITEFASMEAKYIIVQSDNGTIGVYFFLFLFAW